MEKSEFNLVDINILNMEKMEKTNGDNNNSDKFRIIKIRKSINRIIRVPFCEFSAYAQNIWNKIFSHGL